MSSYEFWDELGKIFNAVVAYQEKNLEFNKRFISPWIRLGNVFEKQDRNNEAMHAYERAIEIDGDNPQNWYELGNIHFKMENYAEAVSAFNRAIELDPSFGWAHNNLALTLASMGEVEQAVALYQKAIDLLQDPKDRAVGWNRLGNAYRKLNEYEQALGAFHRADELDRENAGFRDNMDEVSGGPTIVDQAAETPSSKASAVLSVSTDDSDETGNATPEDPVRLTQAEDRAAELSTDQVVAPASITGAESTPAPLEAKVPALEAVDAASVPEAVQSPDEQTSAEPPIANLPGPDNAEARGEETVTVVVQDGIETFTETVPIAQSGNDTTDGGELAISDKAIAAAEGAQATDVVTSDEAPLAEIPTPTLPVPEEKEADAVGQQEFNEAVLDSVVAPMAVDELLDPAPNSLADQLLEAEPEVLDVAQQVAYEAFLKDTSEPTSGFGTHEEDEAEVEMPGSPEPAAKIDGSGELQIEMDTKNAHVWNELGNVYFNTSAFDDAIVAYSKAIELDRWFAWPYSNLALAYVQKRRFVEAILLYQRSIELFSTDKDKAISWNRLGNVYRRLNDYENAIAAYQRADALDPDNSTLSLQSRFSLLGNYAMEQKPSYVS